MEGVTVDEILSVKHKEGYSTKEVLDHDDLLPFVKQNFHNRNLIIYLFWVQGLTGLAFLIYTVYNMADIASFWMIILWIFAGLFSTILLVPVHEGLHGLAYKICGAREVSYGANWKQLYFTASAHLFTANFRQFLVIGLAPFIMISISAISLYMIASDQLKLFIASSLWFHNLMCVGDFSILGYFYQYRNYSPVTFDDMDTKRSYFLIRE